jgi:hypothetical protein
MSDWNPIREAIKTLFALAGTVIALFVGWLFGQRLTYLWNVRQKRREFQLAASQQFYSAYGEFFATWKLWNRVERNLPDFEARRWELQKRAAAAEATVEAILVKLSSELTLSQIEIETLGLFRQAFQHLREAIREGCVLSWTTSEHPEYSVFKGLATRVSALLAREWHGPPPSAEEAESQLLSIAANHWEKLRAARFKLPKPQPT